MKRLSSLMVIALMIGLSITANCQSRSDSTVIHLRDARKGAIWAERGMACVEEMRLLERRNELLVKRIELKDSSLTDYSRKEQNYENMLSNYKAIVLNNEEQLRIKDQINTQLSKDIKKQKRKTTVVFTLAVAAITYLLVSK